MPCHLHTTSTTKAPIEPAREIIRLSHISIGWESRSVLSNVSLSVNQGDFIAITGPNGGGKTTLLRIILRLLKPDKGTVTYLDAQGLPTRHLAIGYLPQKNLIDSHFPVTVRQVIASGLLATPHIDKDSRLLLTRQTIQLMGLQEKTDAPIGTLSGGQLQRALLGRAIISKPRVLILDEPLSYIDKRFEAHLYDIIREIAENTTIILVSHEMSTIAGIANRHFIVDGSIHECTASHHYIHSDCDD